MGKISKFSFLLSLFVTDKLKQEKILRSIDDNISDEAVLEFLKEKKLVSTGTAKEDIVSYAPQNADYVDELIYEYFRYKEEEWIIGSNDE